MARIQDAILTPDKMALALSGDQPRFLQPLTMDKSMTDDQKQQKAKLEEFGLDYYKRQSGRTHRMMEAAKMAAESGKPVTVLMRDEHQAKHWIERGWAVPGMEITWMRIRPDFIDWDNLKLNDHRRNNVLFIDHDVVYSCFKHLLRVFTEYDAPMEPPEYIKDILYPPSKPVVENMAEEPVDPPEHAKTSVFGEAVAVSDENSDSKSLGNVSFLEYQSTLNQVFDDMLRNISTLETENPLTFCYSLGQLKGKLLKDWKDNFGSATAA